MTWIEQISGIAPDGGSGLTELLVAIGAALVVAMIAFARVRWRGVDVRRAK